MAAPRVAGDAAMSFASPRGKKPPLGGQRMFPAGPAPGFAARPPDRMSVVSVLVQRACLYLGTYGAARRAGDRPLPKP